MAAPDSKRAIINGVIAVAIAAVVVGCLTQLRGLRWLDAHVYDQLMRVRGDQGEQPGTSIVLVTIDEESLGVTDAWPWPRATQAKIVENLYAAGASKVALDILYIEASIYGEADDQAFADCLRAHPQTVLAAKLEADTRKLEDGSLQVSSVRILPPYALYRELANWGVVNVDDSGPGRIIREYQPYFSHQDQVYPSFATAIYTAAFNHPPDLSEDDVHYIDFRGPPGSFESVPAYLVLNGQADPDLFRSAIVLIGATFADSHDFHAIPLARPDGSSQYMGQSDHAAGVEVHANILSSLMSSTRIRNVPRWVQTLVALAICALVGYLMLLRSAPIVLVSVAIVIVGSIFATSFMFTSMNVVYDLVYPISAVLITAIALIIPLRQPLVLYTKVGPYHLYEELGRGGMAVVYRARHPRTGKIVALKQMLPQYSADPDSLHRFVREIELIRSLDHPNIIAIVDHGDVDGQPYYAMEYIEGDTLEDILKDRKRIDGSNVRRFAGAIARALAQSHAVGVIHRDIKPSNIMLTKNGDPKLTDFGIAKKSNAPQLTQTGQIVGTPFYMAPELLKGYKASPQSDIYSLGATMYHLLTGRPIFQSDEVQTILTMVLFDEPTDIRRIASDIDEDLAELVMACVEKEPEDRPESMVEVAKRLDPFYTGVITMPPGTKSEPLMDAPTPMPGGVNLDATTERLDRPATTKAARALAPSDSDKADSPRTFIMKSYEPPTDDADDDEFGPPPDVPPLPKRED